MTEFSARKSVLAGEGSANTRKNPNPKHCFGVFSGVATVLSSQCVRRGIRALPCTVSYNWSSLR